MVAFLTDLAHAGRVLRRQPGFSLLTMGILGAGIGAATLVFSLVYTVVLRDLPFADPDRLMWMYNLRTERDRAPLSVPDFEDYRQSATTVSDFAVFTNWTTNLTGSGPAERLEAVRVSGDFFRVLGTVPLHGRTLAVGDDRGEARAVVVTYGLWQRRFGGRADLVGQTITLNGAAHTVVGVLPRGFLFPFRGAELAVPLPLHADPRRSQRGANFLRVIARLAPGVAVSQARDELNTIARVLQLAHPVENSRKTGISLYPLHREIVRDYERMLWTLLAAVGVLLAVGCGNLANLMLLRGVAREPELALRIALGASRARIVRQLTLEAVPIAAGAALIGVAISTAGLAVWRAAGAPDIPLLAEATLNLPVLGGASTIASIVVAACGLGPAHATSSALDQTIGRGRGTTENARFARRAFVALQVAGSVVLLVCMSLVVRAFARLEQENSGFTPANALALQLSLPPQTYADRERIVALYDRLSDRIRSLPSVETAGAISLMPLTGLLSTMDIALPDRPAPSPEEVPQAHFRIATAGYFAAAGIPILAGRAFDDRDTAASQPVAMVSRTFAERHWTGGMAVGKVVQLVQPGSTPREIVGVAGDVKQFGIEDAPTPDLYVPLQQMPQSQVQFLAARMYWIVRAPALSPSLPESLRQAVAGVDAEIAASGIRTLDDILGASLASRRVNARLLEAFSGVALLLCAVGIYARAAFSVRTRDRELAIRMALGATGRKLHADVLLEEAYPLLSGLAAGLAIAALAAPRLGSLLFGVDPVAWPTYAAAGAVLVIVGVTASYLPARRASRADPSALLRA